MHRKGHPYNVRVLVDSSVKSKKNKKGKTKSKFTERSSSTYADGSSTSQSTTQTTNKRGKTSTSSRVVIRDSKGKKTAAQTTRNGKTRTR